MKLPIRMKQTPKRLEGMQAEDIWQDAMKTTRMVVFKGEEIKLCPEQTAEAPPTTPLKTKERKAEGCDDISPQFKNKNVQHYCICT